MPGDPRLEECITRQVHLDVKESQDNLLSHLDDLISTRLSAFQKQISSERRELSETQIPKIELQTSVFYTFKKTGNAKQYLSNAKVLDKLK